MQYIEPRDRKPPFKTAQTHARLCHDYAVWHPAHLKQVLAKTSPRLPFEHPRDRKSRFDSATIIDDAIAKSIEHIALVANNGYHIVVFDMGHQVGFDEVAGRSTSTVTVVLKPSGEVVTAHPGNAWIKDQQER
jgi:hypothetical protein